LDAPLEAMRRKRSLALALIFVIQTSADGQNPSDTDAFLCDANHRMPEQKISVAAL
jgi:hypothetical protein